jgi:hypothetical protein
MQRIIQEMENYSKIELLMLIKTYNKTHDDKIKNVDKMKKDELIEICEKYALSDDSQICTIRIDLRNVCKKDLMRDVQLYFMKKNQNIPQNVAQMRKHDLIDYMEVQGIKHYTPDILEKELEELHQYNMLKNVITYNIIRYDNVDIMQLDNDLNTYIIENKLDTNIDHMHAYALLLRNLLCAYELFCKDIGKEYEMDKIKSIPKILARIENICKNN